MFYSITLGLAVLLQRGLSQGGVERSDRVVTGMTSLPTPDTPRTRLTVEPPGPSVYVGEVVSLWCQLDGSTTTDWTYTWYPPATRTTMTPIPGHRSTGGRYTIFGVLPSDQGPYRCQAERTGPSPTAVLSNTITLTVMDLPPGTLTVTPDSRRHFRGDGLSLHCRSSCSSTTVWTLKHLNEQAIVETGCCPGGSMRKRGRQTCDFPSLNSCNSGLYWCESGGQRTNAIDITVDESPVIIQGPTQSVSHGGNVTLQCRYRRFSPKNITFYKDGMEIETREDGKMTMWGVTKEDEGFYWCSGEGTEMISAETWVSVTGSSVLTSREGVADPEQPLMVFSIGSSTAEEIVSQQPNLHSKGIATSTIENKSPSPEQMGKSLSEGPELFVVMICIVIFLMLIPALGILVYRCSHLEFPPSSRCSIADSESQYPGQNSPQPKEDPWSMTWVEMMIPLNNQDHHESQEETEPQMDDPHASQA